MCNKSGRISIGPFLFGEGVVEYIVDIVSHANELLLAVADGNDDGSDTSIKNRLHINSSRGIREKSAGGHSTVNFMVDYSEIGLISNYYSTWSNSSFLADPT